jgi:hypothetical protein
MMTSEAAEDFGMTATRDQESRGIGGEGQNDVTGARTAKEKYGCRMKSRDAGGMTGWMTTSASAAAHHPEAYLRDLTVSALRPAALDPQGAD